MIVRGNHIDVPSNAQQAIITDAHQSIIKDNHIRLVNASGDPSTGIRVNDSYADFPKEHTIFAGNSFVAEPDSPDSYGISLTTDLQENITITENTFRNLNRGIGSNLTPGVKITSNGFYNCNTGIISDNASGFRVADNEFMDCGDACHVTDLENVTFSGNYIQGCNYAFLAEGGADNNILLFNQVDSLTISTVGANTEEHHTMSIDTANYSTNSSYYDVY